jgi:hypothetical protein
MAQLSFQFFKDAIYASTIVRYMFIVANIPFKKLGADGVVQTTTHARGGVGGGGSGPTESV